MHFPMFFVSVFLYSVYVSLNPQPVKKMIPSVKTLTTTLPVLLRMISYSTATYVQKAVASVMAAATILGPTQMIVNFGLALENARLIQISCGNSVGLVVAVIKVSKEYMANTELRLD